MSRSHPKALGLLLLALATAATPLTAKEVGTKAEQADARKKLDDVRNQIDALSREQRDTANQRDSANAALAKQAEQVAAAAKAVHQADAALADKERDLAQLNQQRESINEGLRGQRAALDDLLRAAYTLGHGTDMQALLGDTQVDRMARALAYSKYFQDDRVNRIKGLLADLSRLQEVEAAIVTEQQALQTQRAQREDSARTLERQRADQQKLVAASDARYTDQGKKLAALKQDEQAMNTLLERLQKVIEEAPKVVDVAPAPGKPSVKVRGDLPWPAAGAVRAHGAGVLIAATRGSEVHAVTRGRVIFANFLRGYGMLIILNHGDGWMSLYGNNEALLHGVGDTIEAGQAVGTAAAPTGDDGGVYFELRQRGKPVDPAEWLSKHK
jgi:septal ring factor EnvC (AmiA/AmiB activator)